MFFLFFFISCQYWSAPLYKQEKHHHCQRAALDVSKTIRFSVVALL